MDDVAVLRVGVAAAGVSGGTQVKCGERCQSSVAASPQSHARDTHILPALPPLPEGAADGRWPAA